MARSRKTGAHIDKARQSALFAGLTNEEVSALLMPVDAGPEAYVGYFKPGERIYGPDAYEKSLGILLSGLAEVDKRGKDSRMLMSLLGPGDLFGAAALFSGSTRYVADILARNATWVMLIPEETLAGMMRRDFRVAENYMRYLTGRIRFLSRRIDGLAEHRPEERLYLYLSGMAQNGVCTLRYPITALADALCVSRPTLYRALGKLAEQGRILRDGNTIALTGGTIE